MLNTKKATTKQNTPTMKNSIKHFAMLSFIALSTKVAAQQNEYQVQRVSTDTIIVKQHQRTDTLTLQQAVQQNESLPLQKQVERNAIIFREVNRKPK